MKLRATFQPTASAAPTKTKVVDKTVSSAAKNLALAYKI